MQFRNVIVGLAAGLSLLLGGAGQKAEAGRYNIFSYNSVLGSQPKDLCLDVPGFSTRDGTIIQQYPINHGLNQAWEVTYKSTVGSTYYYEIQSDSSGKVLDIPFGAAKAGLPLQQYTRNNGDNQRWSFQYVGSWNGYGVYVIKNKASGMVLDVPNGYNGVTNLQQYPQNGSYGSSNQWWVLVPW